jgi:ATP-dependent Clp protease adaptor protein ClpS
MYNVIMHNDDVTTMDFVVYVLVRIFRKSEDDAETLMLKVHNEGSAIVGTYSQDIAQSKANYTMNLAKANNFPLQLTIEETR